MLINYSLRLYHAILVFISVSLWVILAAGIIEYFQWNSMFDLGLLIHSGIIIISVGSVALMIKSKNILVIFDTLNFNKSTWGYYLIAIVLAIIIWLADFWLQLFFFLDDGRKGGLALQAEIKQFGILSIVISSCLLAPAAEEILFRGILLKGLLEKVSPFFAILLSSLLFATIHFSSQDFISLFIAAFGYALLTVKSESILPAFLAHLLNNSVTVYYMATL
ncbi:MAG: CPBP family intramembrane metalloprotease [Methylococcales bacterium]|nr:CPBP family intramembrane metalloprotease [Methylococcales bacterium]